MANWERREDIEGRRSHYGGPLYPPQGYYQGGQGWGPGQPSHRQYIPTMVYQPRGFASNEEYGQSVRGGSRGANQTGAVPKQGGNNNYPRRKNKAPLSQRGYNPDRRPSAQERQPLGPSVAGSGRNPSQDDAASKLEGRKKLLAEAASFLSSCSDNDRKENFGRKENWGGNNNNSDAGKNYSRHRGGDRHDWRTTKQYNQDSVCQRERLTQQLRTGTLECLVCCDKIRQTNSVWACSNCHHVLHLKCVAKWASTSKSDNGWRCPACQNVSTTVPQDYTCMCGKVTDPQWMRGETPHCCGQTCGKTGTCVHKCTLACHPGPCPPCSASVNKACGCGRTGQVVLCSGTAAVLCGQTCAKVLDCGVHVCAAECHPPPCAPCDVIIHQVCYCGRCERDVRCDREEGGATKYSCLQECPGRLSCGEHPCSLACHPPPCPPCPRAPSAVATCPCGKRPLSPRARTRCSDPVPPCGAPCGKALACGPPGAGHSCALPCHEGECPPCRGQGATTAVRCRCGYMEREVPCEELTARPRDALCQKRCTKKRSCGKHKCNQTCCIEVEHICTLLCNKTLTCGRHKCQQLCHRGHCQPCTAASFEELRCECGTCVIYPPVACGTRLPECRSPCPREHACEHPPLHNCHSAPTCPPCTVLTAKHCYAKHELRKTVPCHVSEYSCGRPCGRALACGHTCPRPCHAGACSEGGACSQPCREARAGCGHPCGAPCHPPPCPPAAPCPAQLKVTCQCGRRSSPRTCSDNASDYRRIATSLLASKMADVQLGLSVDPDINVASKMSLKTLECNDDCKIYERNLRMAIGLQIVNPDLSSKLSPRYTDFMKAWAKKDPRLCQLVHDKLTQLVQLSKQSKQKSRAYSFEPMNRDKRQLVHEYCKHFGCESVAYDAEPKRNIVATAYKDKCWLPSYSLLEMIQRENGMRKVPLPSLKKETIKNVQMSALQKSGSTTQTSSVANPPKPEEPKASPPPPPIDYFDYTN